jgi:hypothetical protein
MATGSQQHARMPGHQAQSTHMSGASPMHNPVDSPQVLGHLAHDRPGVTITPRSHLHCQSHKNPLAGGNVKCHDSHHATCDDTYMCIKMKTCPLCNPPKLHEGISGSNSEAQEPTMAPTLHSDALRHDTTLAYHSCKAL